MTIDNRSLFHVLMKMLVILLMLFLCSVPIFYLTVYYSIYSRDLSNVYIVARAIRFLAVILIGCIMRKRNQEILIQSGSFRKKLMNLILGLICVSIWLHYDNTTARLYHAVSDIVDISNLESTPLFLSVLWEQLFVGDFYWSILICLSIMLVTFRLPTKRKLQKNAV